MWYNFVRKNLVPEEYIMTYNLFISHSWTYSDAYEKLLNLLDEKPYFYYKDYSVPKDDPIHTNGTDKQLYDAIDAKIRGCSCVIILAGVYAVITTNKVNKAYKTYTTTGVVPVDTVA